MYQGTTPAIPFTIKGYDLSDATVYITFFNNNNLMTKSGEDVETSYDEGTETSTIVCKLTQQETLDLKRGSVRVQIRFIYENGEAYATNKAVIEVNDVLLQEVIKFVEVDDG